MTHTFRTQATAFSLAAFVTLSLMASINHLATSPAPEGMLARVDAAPVQVVVITAKRNQV